MSRKTFNVEKLVDQLNTTLQAGYPNREFRLGAIAMVETVLHETGNYGGFRYLDQTEVADTELPGVRVGANGDCLSYEERFHNTDDSRRQYFYSGK